MCGVTVRFVSFWSTLSGLSPRVRGHLYRIVRNRLESRSIPACAGSPYTGIPETTALEVYPRVCGVTEKDVHTLELWDGLSPRVRGHPTSRISDDAWEGSIPACAGSPQDVRLGTRVVEVYPRVCGVTRER